MGCVLCGGVVGGGCIDLDCGMGVCVCCDVILIEFVMCIC